MLKILLWNWYLYSRSSYYMLQSTGNNPKQHNSHPNKLFPLPTLSLVSLLLSLLVSPLPLPQITAVFTRALADLPTRPRKRPHSPRQGKIKTQHKSYQASACLCCVSFQTKKQNLLNHLFVFHCFCFFGYREMDRGTTCRNMLLKSILFSLPDKHTPPLYFLPLQRAHSFLLSFYFSWLGH